MNWLWRLKVPAKIQHFQQLCFHNALPINARWHHCNMIASSSCTRCSSPIEDILQCLRDCPHSREFWLQLNMRRYNNFFSEFDVKVWLHEMTKGTSSILFVTGVWYAWCWRSNTMLRINIGVFMMWGERPFYYMVNAFLTISVLVWTHTHRAS